MFFSSDTGKNWTQVNNGFTDLGVYALDTIGTNIFAGTFEGSVFLTTNNGTSWKNVSNGLNHNPVNALAVSGNIIFAGVIGGVYFSTNNGTNWTQVNNGLMNTQIQALAVMGNNLFASTNLGVFISTNNGTNWTQVNNGLTTPNIWCFITTGTNIFAASNGVFLSTNYGTNWVPVNDGGLPLNDLSCFAINGNNIFVGTGEWIWKRPLSELVGVFKDINDLPKNFTLSQNYPNPFNPTTKIDFEIPSEGYTVIKLYDLLGNEVSTLLKEIKKAGYYSIILNASYLPSGMYLCKMQSGIFVSVKKLMLTK